ncbi:hypothetical protein [Tepidibacter sp.]|uniref:hypothetical protein n=1 Tax=Tepidibacter sp. TaxID=2529387 RepID=UPI002ED4EF30
MYFNPMFFQQPMRKQNKKSYILDFEKGDVNGDKVDDNVYLIGDKPFGDSSPFRDNIRIKIVDSKTGRQYIIPLKENAGYNPTIFLGDFTGDGVDNIFVAIDSGGSGGYAFYYIYSFLRNKPKLIFDFEKFNKDNKYEVNYMDYYEVEVIKESDKERYILNIEYKGDKYLSEIYNEDGTLKESISGWVNPLGGLYPIDFNRDGVYELYALQRIAGRYNADGLGYVQTSLKWDGSSFSPFFQSVGIPGSEKEDEIEIVCEADLSDVKYIYSENIKDEKLEEAIIDLYKLEPSDNTRYYYNRIDFDSDGVPEVFVYLVGSSTCGTGGCSAAIFKEVNGEYENVSRFTLVNTPVIVSNTKTNGYNDLIMNVSGGGIEPFCAVMKYDGSNYPKNPSTQPKLEEGIKVTGIGIINDEINPNTGIPIGF